MTPADIEKLRLLAKAALDPALPDAERSTSVQRLAAVMPLVLEELERRQRETVVRVVHEGMALTTEAEIEAALQAQAEVINQLQADLDAERGARRVPSEQPVRRCNGCGRPWPWP